MSSCSGPSSPILTAASPNLHRHRAWKASAASTCADANSPLATHSSPSRIRRTPTTTPHATRPYERTRARAPPDPPTTPTRPSAPGPHPPNPPPTPNPCPSHCASRANPLLMESKGLAPPSRGAMPEGGKKFRGHGGKSG